MNNETFYFGALTAAELKAKVAAYRELLGKEPDVYMRGTLEIGIGSGRPHCYSFYTAVRVIHIGRELITVERNPKSFPRGRAAEQGTYFILEPRRDRPSNG